jgi:hypothetical protein
MPSGDFYRLVLAFVSGLGFVFSFFAQNKDLKLTQLKNFNTS